MFPSEALPRAKGERKNNERGKIKKKRYVEGFVPGLLTWHGRNIDAVTALLAAGVAARSLAGGVPGESRS